MTMMAFYKASEKFGMECMQLTPAFEIDLFAEPDNEEYNVIGFSKKINFKCWSKLHTFH